MPLPSKDMGPFELKMSSGQKDCSGIISCAINPKITLFEEFFMLSARNLLSLLSILTLLMAASPLLADPPPADPVDAARLACEEHAGDCQALCLKAINGLDVQLDEAIALPINAPGQKEMQKQMKAKLKAVGELDVLYTELAELGGEEAKAAAAAKVARLFNDIAQKIKACPVPPSLNQEESELYRETLREVALPLEEKAKAAEAIAKKKIATP